MRQSLFHSQWDGGMESRKGERIYEKRIEAQNDCYYVIMILSVEYGYWRD